jgi:diaminopimelate decarboxylase
MHSALYGKELTLIFEPGNSCSEAGYFLAKVNVVKQTFNCFLLDSGFNHLIRPMLYGSYTI